MVSKDCIFCKIIAGEIKSNFLLESDHAVAFADINPVAQTHILIVPKKHIESVAAIEDSDGQDIVEMFRAARQLVKKNNLQDFRLAFNGGGYQHVGHLHMHLLAGGNVKWNKL